MKPILFNTQMVQAILDGHKTVTRRLINPQPTGKVKHFTGYKTDFWGEDKVDSRGVHVEILKPPYQLGDVLYVREKWAKDPFGPGYIYPTEIHDAGQPWKPSIHMPKEAARLFLKVESIEAQRLQDFLCCRNEIIKEGIPFDDYKAATKRFMTLWDSTVNPADKRNFSFVANPWVWAIGFERCEKPEQDVQEGDYI